MCHHLAFQACDVCRSQFWQAVIAASRLQIHRITDDGVKFKQLYHTTTFPYVAILDPRTGKRLHTFSVSHLQYVYVCYLHVHIYIMHA